MFPPHLLRLAETLLAACKEARLKIATAESCTGGLVAACLTEIAGSSDVVDRGFVVYSNEAKRDLLEVPGDLIADYGAVSEPVARAMAEGALDNSAADLSVSITGIAGPGGGTGLKPIGLVHFATARRGGGIQHQEHRLGDIGRDAVRERSVEIALEFLHSRLNG